MNRKRVQELRNMLAGIPENNINLNDWFVGHPDVATPPKPSCRTIACIAGWALIYPPFLKAGIRKRDWWPDEAASTFFGIPSEVFEIRNPDEAGTDKEIALRRLDKILGQTPTTE